MKDRETWHAAGNGITKNLYKISTFNPVCQRQCFFLFVLFCFVYFFALFFAKEPIEHILDFIGYEVSVITISLCCCKAK